MSLIGKRASDEIYRSLQASFRIKKFLCLRDFIENGFKLTDGDRFSKYDWKLSPWCLEVSDWFDDPNVQRIILMQGSQTSKTQLMMGILDYISKEMRGSLPCMWIRESEQQAKDFAAKRLKSFLQSGNDNFLKGDRWKNEFFRVNNATLKFAFATTEYTGREVPIRFMFGDECSAWSRITIPFAMKRCRTFRGREKGIFGTTPPEDVNHHSWKQVLISNCYQYWPQCPKCKKRQALKFSCLDYSHCKHDGQWDLDEVQKTTVYVCEHCQDRWHEDQKKELLLTGKMVCVDPANEFRPCGEKKSRAKTLQLSSLYSPSVFTTWGDVAVNFLEAKMGSIQDLRDFFTHELAEPLKEVGRSFKKNRLKKFVDLGRKSGQFIPNTEFYTCGVDVQQKGQLYITVVAWKKSKVPVARLLKFGVVNWIKFVEKDGEKVPMKDFGPLYNFIKFYLPDMRGVAIDSSQGLVAYDIYDVCRQFGHPFIPLKENIRQDQAVKFTTVDKNDGKISGLQLMLVNSGIVKDDIANALDRDESDPDAWSFPGDISDEFLRHMTNEHRTEERRNNRVVSVWKPKYAKADQHYFSSFVYAVCAMYPYRNDLIESVIVEKLKDNIDEIEDSWIPEVDWFN